MKRLILLALVVGLAAATWWVVRRSPSSAPSAQPPADSALAPEPDNAAPVDPVPAPETPRRRNAAAAQERPAIPQRMPPIPIPSLPAFDEATALRQTVEMLVSPETPFNEKQAAWIKLRNGGGLDRVVAELERLAASDPSVAGYPAALGQAYLHKIATLQDVREQGILGLKADQSFDLALGIDASNWEASFSKTMAMSYWPAEMNKSTEVIERFNDLIQQQEATAPQPHFAQTYLWLGDQYQKVGRADYADQTWRRGAALFPSEPTLQKKLTP